MWTDANSLEQETQAKREVGRSQVEGDMIEYREFNDQMSVYFGKEAMLWPIIDEVINVTEAMWPITDEVNFRAVMLWPITDEVTNITEAVLWRIRDVIRVPITDQVTNVIHVPITDQVTNVTEAMRPITDELTKAMWPITDEVTNVTEAMRPITDEVTYVVAAQQWYSDQRVDKCGLCWRGPTCGIWCISRCAPRYQTADPGLLHLLWRSWSEIR